MKLRKTLAGILGAVVMLLGVGTFEHINRDTGVRAAETFEKATSIAAGDTVLLVCESKNMELNGISTTSTKYGIGVAYTGVPSGKYELKVEAGSSSGTFSFKTTNGQYLYWTSGNSLATNANKSANTSWTVTFPSGNATIKNNKDSSRVIGWNASSPRFACYTSSQTAVQLYKKVVSNIETLESPAVTLDETTGIVNWTAVNNANGYTYKLNGNEKTTQGTSLQLNSGDTFSVKANGTEGKFNDSKYTEEITFTSYTDKVVSLLEDEYNKGHYLRHTIINIDADAVMEDLERLNENLNPEEKVNYADLFHAEVTMLERNTYFDGNQLWMENEEGTYSYYGTSENGKDLTSDRVSTLEEKSDKVVLKNVGGMEGYYTTLTDIIEHSKNAAWTYSNGVYKSTDDKLIKDFLDFTAPCFYNAFSKGGLENYIKLSSVTVQNLDDQVVLKLLVENGDSGKLVENSNFVLSQATISKLSSQIKNPITISFDNDANRKEYDTSHQVWVQNGITVTNNKGSSTSNVGDYVDPARFYKSSEVIIESDNAFNTVVIDVSGMDAKYCTPYTETLSALGTVTIENQIVTLVLNESTTSIIFTTTAQVRANYITLSYEA